MAARVGGWILLVDPCDQNVPDLEIFLETVLRPSRPSPDCLTPPNGAISVDRIPEFTHTIPGFHLLGDTEDAPDVARVNSHTE